MELAKDILNSAATAAIFMLIGMFIVIHYDNKDCAEGKPRVVDGKVYRCIESK